LTADKRTTPGAGGSYLRERSNNLTGPNGLQLCDRGCTGNLYVYAPFAFDRPRCSVGKGRSTDRSGPFRCRARKQQMAATTARLSENMSSRSDEDLYGRNQLAKCKSDMTVCWRVATKSRSFLPNKAESEIRLKDRCAQPGCLITLYVIAEWFGGWEGRANGEQRCGGWRQPLQGGRCPRWERCPVGPGFSFLVAWPA